jgi:alanine racemase
MPHTQSLDGVTGLVTVDLAQIAANWRALAALVRPAECSAVVKADAYGLGVRAVVPALVHAGCRTFFVATADEAAEVRDLTADAVIYVLDGLVAGSGPRLADIGARPALATLDDCLEWAALCESRDRVMAAALHIDTGLNRLGLPASDVTALAADPSLFNRIGVSLVMSHLACADTPGAPLNAAQLLAFEQLRAALPPAPASLAASDGLMLGADYHFDMVRPGYALYGGQPTKGMTAPVAPAVRVQARVLQVRDVEAGASIGYAATWRTAERTRVATIAAGYADGVARAASSTPGVAGGQVAFKGRLAPVVGRVSMDLVTADVTGLGEAAPRRGDFVDLIGPGLTLETVGASARTIGYEVLTRLPRRFVRRYLPGHAVVEA